MLGSLGNSTIQSAAPLLYGDAGTEQTIQKIRELVNDAWGNLDTRRFAIDILRSAGAPQYDDWSKVEAIYSWVKNYFYFVLDPVSKEVLMPFPDLVVLGAGDCDEINATAMAILMGVVGYEPRLVTVAANSDDPESFSHVYCEVFVQGNWIPMDAARPGAQIGVEPPSYYRRRWWSLTDDSYGDYSGPGQLDGLRRRRRLAGLNGYDRVTLGQDDGSGADNINPLTGEVYGSPGDISAAPGLYPGVPAPSDPGINWASLLNSGVQLGTNIAKAVLAPTPGYGSVLVPAIGSGGYPTTSPTGLTLASSTTLQGNTLLMFGAAAFLLFLLVKK